MFKGISRYNIGMESLATVSDTLLEASGLLKELPIINAAATVYQATNNFINKHNLNKLNSFIISFNNGVLGNAELEAHIKSVLENNDVLDQEMEYVLVILERQLEYDKSAILAKFYLEYLKGKISWDDFAEYSAILERLILSDTSTLWQCNNSDGIRYEDTEDIASVFRLLALGLVYMPAKNTHGALARADGYVDFKPTISGRKFSEILNL